MTETANCILKVNLLFVLFLPEAYLSVLYRSAIVIHCYLGWLSSAELCGQHLPTVPVAKHNMTSFLKLLDSKGNRFDYQQGLILASCV